jgi:hypothetical protein
LRREEVRKVGEAERCAPFYSVEEEDEKDWRQVSDHCGLSCKMKF